MGQNEKVEKAPKTSWFSGLKACMIFYLSQALKPTGLPIIENSYGFSR